MKDYWDYKLMDLLKDARLGNTDELNELLSINSHLAVVNKDFSVLIVFRHFKLQNRKEKRRVLNCKPEDKNFQYGITIITSSELGNSQGNFYLPNNLNYKELKINKNEIEIITDKKSVLTNVIELKRKRKFSLDQSEQEIENSFNSLNNEQYENLKKPKIENNLIELSSVGKLKYNREFEWFEGKLKVDDKIINLSIYNAEPTELENIISFADKQIKSKFYNQMLLEIEEKMIKLKNDAWLEDGEIKSTVENFRKKISIESIVFNNDCSSLIYCNDNDMFWEHAIEISVDKNGQYSDANLVG